MHAWRARRAAETVLFVAAGLGFLAGLFVAVGHLARDPLADVRAYYDAGARLNAGLPLYDQDASTNEAAFYRYPPLLAIVFRPLALLPFEVAAIAWAAVLVVLFGLTLRRVWRGRWTLVALGLLGVPIGWSLTIGQAEVVVTFLMALAAPWSVAIAANLKVFPALAALYWVGRRDVRSIGWFAVIALVLLAIQVVLEPRATVDFPSVLRLEHVGEVRNFSPYAWSPPVWAILVTAGVAAAIALARTRFGWPVAVALAVLVTPRLLTYHLMTLLAAFAEPRESTVRRPQVREQPADEAASAPGAHVTP